jgi:hypothetical protein
MLSEQECVKILNDGDVRFNKEEVKQIRELVLALATIEYESSKKKKYNERNLLRAS